MSSHSGEQTRRHSERRRMSRTVVSSEELLKVDSMYMERSWRIIPILLTSISESLTFTGASILSRLSHGMRSRNDNERSSIWQRKSIFHTMTQYLERSMLISPLSWGKKSSCTIRISEPTQRGTLVVTRMYSRYGKRISTRIESICSDRSDGSDGISRNSLHSVLELRLSERYTLTTNSHSSNGYETRSDSLDTRITSEIHTMAMHFRPMQSSRSRRFSHHYESTWVWRAEALSNEESQRRLSLSEEWQSINLRRTLSSRWSNHTIQRWKRIAKPQQRLESLSMMKIHIREQRRNTSSIMSQRWIDSRWKHNHEYSSIRSQERLI